MPFTRISLRRGKSPDYLAAIGESLHRALVETFDVPAADRCQIFHQHEANELVFDPTYLGGPRSEDYVLFAITAGKPRSPAVKQAFYTRLVELLKKAPGIRPEDVMVVISTTEMVDWSFSGGIAATAAAGAPNTREDADA